MASAPVQPLPAAVQRHRPGLPLSHCCPPAARSGHWRRQRGSGSRPRGGACWRSCVFQRRQGLTACPGLRWPPPGGSVLGPTLRAHSAARFCLSMTHLRSCLTQITWWPGDDSCLTSGNGGGGGGGVCWVPAWASASVRAFVTLSQLWPWPHQEKVMQRLPVVQWLAPSKQKACEGPFHGFGRVWVKAMFREARPMRPSQPQ